LSYKTSRSRVWNDSGAADREGIKKENRNKERKRKNILRFIYILLYCISYGKQTPFVDFLCKCYNNQEYAE